ncbi:hypothetical protein HYC85_010166 [Camellia sinensis]|uniref:Lipoxygenase domain-containing protein n=1 Tax=Camellia sinensis TaxID=4442 RepID=A0A7J7HH58_CAMSI|nr:hypothetical protein HYC85_010166 [Camellia sinensis]
MVFGAEGKIAWRTDEEFAKEMLVRLDPVIIRHLQAIEKNRLFKLDHHDALMTLKHLAIESSLPHPKGDQFGAISKVYTPSEHDIEGSLWQLAKAYVAVNDSDTINSSVTECHIIGSRKWI